jgi:hypothetical protein
MRDLVHIGKNSKPARPARRIPRPTRLPINELLDRLTRTAELSEVLCQRETHAKEPQAAALEFVQTMQVRLDRAQAAIDDGTYDRDLSDLRGMLEFATMTEISNSIGIAVRKCLIKPPALDVGAYTLDLIADVADMGLTRIELARVVVWCRTETDYLISTARIFTALDALSEEGITLANGTRMSLRDMLAAIEALPDRLEATRRDLEACRARIDRAAQRCLSDMEFLPAHEVEARWRPEIIEAAKRKASGAIEARKAPRIEHSPRNQH